MTSSFAGYLAGYVAAVVVIVALDALWLGLIAKATYRAAIGHLMADKPKVPAALAFYALYPLGLMIFAIAPQAHDPALGSALVLGALFGFFAYGTYDLSNLATLKGWPVRLALIDMAWGTSLSATAALAGKAALNWAASG